MGQIQNSISNTITQLAALKTQDPTWRAEKQKKADIATTKSNIKNLTKQSAQLGKYESDVFAQNLAATNAANQGDISAAAYAEESNNVLKEISALGQEYNNELLTAKKTLAILTGSSGAFNDYFKSAIYPQDNLEQNEGFVNQGIQNKMFSNYQNTKIALNSKYAAIANHLKNKRGK